MKKLLSLLFFSIAVISCSSSDDDNGQPQEEPQFQASNYFPLTANSNWTYNNQSEEGASRDSIYVVGTQTVNGNLYTNIDGEAPVDGLMTRTFSNNLVRATESQFIINGEFTSPIPEIPFGIPLNDVVLFDVEAQNTAELSSLTDSFTQEIQGFPLTFTYTATSLQLETLSTYDVGEQSFENVISSQIVLNLQVTTEISVGGTSVAVDILTPQDVLVTTNYYAQDVGLIYSETLTEYQLEDLEPFGITFPFPSEVSATATQTIDTYLIGE